MNKLSLSLSSRGSGSDLSKDQVVRSLKNVCHLCTPAGAIKVKWRLGSEIYSALSVTELIFYHRCSGHQNTIDIC